MAKKKSAKKAVKKVAKKKAATVKHVIPGDCGPLVDYILGVMEDDEAFNLEEALEEFQACADFLADLPGNVRLSQMDLSEFSFTKDAEKIIKTYIAKHK